MINIKKRNIVFPFWIQLFLPLLIILLLLLCTHKMRSNREFRKMKRVGNSPFRLNSMIILICELGNKIYGKKNNRRIEEKNKMNGTFSAFLLFAT